MPVKKISELVAGAGVSGTEKIPAVQGGDTVYITPDAIASRVRALLGISSAQRLPITSDTVLPANACGLYAVNAASGSVTITLPDATAWAASLLGLQIVIKRLDLSSNNVTVVPPSGNTMEGGPFHLAPGSPVWIHTDNASVWYPLS